MPAPLPYSRQSIDEDDINAVAEVLRGDFLTTGPKVAAFEAAFCKATGAREAVACSNGTTALHLAALALGLQKGDTVIVPSVTFLASANAVRHCGAEVVFADVDPETGLMGAGQAEDALRNAGAKVKAIMAVHLGGHFCDLKNLSALAKKNNLKLIADACHALGGSYESKPGGACGYEDMSTFSFHPVKAIATGEGGAVTTNDKALAEKMRVLRSHGMEKNESPEKAGGPWVYEMNELGFNYRLTDISAALGISQMKKLSAFIEKRRQLAAQYDALLKPLGNAIEAPKRGAGSAWHLYAARIDFDGIGVSRAEFMKALAEQGIGSQVHYIPVHTQPYYKKRYGDLKLPGAEKYYARTLSLPLFPAMNDDDVERVVGAVRGIAG